MRIFLLTIFLGFAMFAAAQDTAYYYTLGTDGKDQAVYGVETNNGFTIFGNSGGSRKRCLRHVCNTTQRRICCR